MWERRVEGRVLTFRLFGINNQNFIMRDEETGSWWQQVTGLAIQGPLKGRRLKGVVHDEVSFEIWRGEEPGGRVLRPAPGAKDDYEDWNWEKQMKKVRTVVPRDKKDRLEPRAMIVGVEHKGRARAYPFPRLKTQSPIVDRLGGEPIALVVGDDRKSFRVFRAVVDGRPLTLLRKAGARPLRLVDAETGSEWDFTGKAVAGPLTGTQLEKLFALKEYWFDWRTYHPDTSVYTLGETASETEVAAPHPSSPPEKEAPGTESALPATAPSVVFSPR